MLHLVGINSFECMKMHGLANPKSSTLVVVCVVRLLFVLFYALFVCKCVLPPGDNPIADKKYITQKKKKY